MLQRVLRFGAAITAACSSIMHSVGYQVCPVNTFSGTRVWLGWGYELSFTITVQPVVVQLKLSWWQVSWPAVPVCSGLAGCCLGGTLLG